MTARSKTSSYCATFEIRVAPDQVPEIRRRQECARQIYNTCLSVLQKTWRRLRASPAWRSALRDVQRIGGMTNPPPEATALKSQAQALMQRIERQYGFSEYDLHKIADKVNKHFGIINPRRIDKKTGAPAVGGILGCSEAQKTATQAWLAFQKFRFGQAKKVRFKRFGDPVTIENKTNSFGLRMEGTQVLWATRYGKKLVFPVLVRKGDKYAEDTFLDKTKYIRLFSREIRGRTRWYVQAVKEGTPPQKNRTAGPASISVGIDASPSTAVVYADSGKAVIEPLAPECAVIAPEIRRINRAIDRSFRSTNPDAYNEDGTIKRGVRLMPSKNCLKLQAIRRELFRVQAAKRRESHERLANRIIAMGTDIKVEDTPISSWTARAKKTSVNARNGRVRSKRRYGKTIANRAPGMLLAIIDRKLRYYGASLRKVNSRRVKASQFDHSTGTYRKKRLDERWAVVDGEKVQRDLYSAFLISSVTGKNFDRIDREKCNEGWMPFLTAQEAVLKNCDKTLGIF